MSLHFRLGLWLALSLLLLFVLHGLVTERAPRVTTEAYITTRLEHDAEWLMSGLNAQGQLTTAHIPAIFLRANSGHYFMLRQGEQAPQLSTSSAGRTLPTPASSGISRGVWDDGEPLLLLRRDLAQGGVLVVAESLRDLNAHLTQFRWRFLLISLGLFALLLLAQFALLHWALRPVRKLAHNGERLQAGELDRLPDPGMQELQPLSRAFNAVLESQARRLARSRHALADLAHGLKTPLAALQQSLHGVNDAVVQTSLARMEGIVQRELRRARWSAGVSPATPLLDIEQELQSLMQAMRLIYRERALNFVLSVPTGAQWSMDREDLHELCGNLLDNAAKWARSRIHLQVSRLDDDWLLCVEDDGAGADLATLNAGCLRGQRLDESQPGTGLGLAIVGEIVAAYGGELTFTQSAALGGLRVCLRFSPTRVAGAARGPDTAKTIT
ncbi:MAG: ATP-binding protein [Pseudomonadota bacterium]